MRRKAMEQDRTSKELRTRIARCRRIASHMTDDEVRHALEDLASEYEARLPDADNDDGFIGRNAERPSRSA